MRGKGTKLGEGERDLASGLLHPFGICVYVWDYYEFRECYVRDCYVWENYVAPLSSIIDICCYAKFSSFS